MTRHSETTTEIVPERQRDQAAERKKSGRTGIIIAVALILAALPFVWGLFSDFTAGVQ